MNAAGKPDIAGFLFEQGTLVREGAGARFRRSGSGDQSG
jgi:hypothetical protein